MAWELFNWGSRGLWRKTAIDGIYMARVLIPQVMRVVLQTRDNQGDVLMNTFHVQAGGPITHEMCQSVADLVALWWDNDYRHMCNNQITGFQTVVTGTDVVPPFQAATGMSTSGDRTGVAVSTSITLAIKGQTGIAGRRYRGRNYMLPATVFDLEVLDPDLFTEDYKTAAVGVWNNLHNVLNSAGYFIGVASYVDGAFHRYTSFIAVDRNVDSQRRRLRGRGG